MYKVIILPLAKKDIQSAANWYNKQEKGLGKKITKQIRKRVKQIQQDPKTVAIRYNETRTAIVKGFPYMIHYLVIEQSKQIVVSAVFHTSQNPKKWRR